MLKLFIINVDFGDFKTEENEARHYSGAFAYDPLAVFDDKNKNEYQPNLLGAKPVKYGLASDAVCSGFVGPGLYDCGFFTSSKKGVASVVLNSIKLISN